MLTIVFEKPNRSISIVGYGVDSYKDKEGKEIWRVYGIVTPATRGRMVSRDSNVIKDIYTDESTVVIYRSSNKEDAVCCKEAIDKTVANQFPIFAVEAFKEWIREEKDKASKAGTVVENAN